jgi:redox-sensitive bicupin YhaK (pirin superfamily)
MEIVTWVLSGALVHQDSEGNHGAIYPGLAQRMSAGTGILHSEKNDGVSDPVHFVQMWVLPDAAGVTPGYEQLEIDDAALRGRLTTVASGMARHRDDAAIRIGNRDAALYVARLQPGESVELPDAPYVHLFVPVGAAALEGAGELAEGDAVRLTAAGSRRVTALTLAEILVWEMHVRA